MTERVTLREAFWVWVKVAVYSFGGPTGQIAVMHRLIVDEKRWISENRFLHALNYCMLLPGPEAQQLAIYVGWLLHKIKGGLIAGTLFVLPGFISILALSILYAGFRNAPFVEALFFGLKPAVIAVVADALIRIGRQALRNSTMGVLAALAFVAIFFFQVPFPLIILGAAVIGFVGGRVRPECFHVVRFEAVEGEPQESNVQDPFLSDSMAHQVRPRLTRALVVVAVCLFLWLGPIAVLAAADVNPIYMSEAIFFSKAAVVTFGGAYAVLAYIAQQAVEAYGWLEPGEMLDGLGMAETTPGPLIQVVQFVGFMGAYRNPGDLDPVMAGIVASVVTTWVTFVPCFLWIFLGAPYIEYLRGKQSLSTALSGITAAVVGVMLNLALWFSIHSLFGEVLQVTVLGASFPLPALSTVEPMAVLITAAAFTALRHYRTGMVKTLSASVLVGLIYHWALR